MFHVTNRRGSALIFTLLLIGLVASLAFFVGRSSLRETRIVGSSQNALGAYYAAEAGLEDGLARLAADRNIEVPTCLTVAHNPGPSETVSDPCNSADGANFNASLSLDNLDKLPGDASYAYPLRVLMAHYDRTTNASDDASLNKVVFSGGNGTVAVDPLKGSNLNNFYYDLRITSRTKKFGNVDGTGSPIESTNNSQSLIQKDAVREFAIDSSGSEIPDRIKYYWTCDVDPALQGAEPCTHTQILSFTFVRKSIVGGTDSTEDFVRYGDLSGERANQNIPFLNQVSNPIIKVRVKALNSGAFLGVAFEKTGPPSRMVYFKGDVAKLQSIGYFAGVKRRLEANVDRNSGALLGLFDYAVYAGSGLTQPQ